MAAEARIIPTEINLDLHEGVMQPNQARFIKNLVYDVMDTSDAGQDEGSQVGVYKLLKSNERYIEDLVLPDGYNQTIGTFQAKVNNEVFVFVYNELGQHIIYRLNGKNRTYNMVFSDPLLNFQLDPLYFIAHDTCCEIVVTYLTNPETGEKIRRSFLAFTDGVNPQRQICVEDAVATNGFDPVLFPYFQGNYDRALLINMGVPTPTDCIEVTADSTVQPKVNNRILYLTFQFRLRYIDVWGRQSEYGVMSHLAIPASNDCIGSASGLPNCWNLLFDAPPPYINQVEVAYRQCNSQQWYTAETLDLYVGTPIGEWWLRQRNPEVDYNTQTGKISYQFCNDKDCKPISPDLTNRAENPLPKTSQAVSKLGKILALSNNKSGFLPFPQDLKDKITVTVEPPEGQSANLNNFRNIDVWMEIYNVFSKTNQPIYRRGITDTTNMRYGFGAHNGGTQYRSFFAYKQYFPNPDQKGFIGILAGANISTVSKQYVLRTDGTLTEVTDFDNIAGINTGVKYFQKFEFRNVPKGKWIFRIVSHQADPENDSLWANTSTYTAGAYGFNINNTANPVDHNFLVAVQKELVIDVCDGNYDGLEANRILVVWDLNDANVDVIAGYIKNTNEADQTQFPIELARIDSWTTVRSLFSDHNGFYFAAGRTRGSQSVSVAPSGFCNCTIVRFSEKFSGSSDMLWEENFFLNNQPNDNSGCPNYNSQPCNYVQIKGRVVLCDSDIGIPNVAVVLTGGGMAFTDSNGNYTLIAHDDSSASSRTDDLYFITTGCPLIGCEGECLEPIRVTLNNCISCDERILNVAPVSVFFKDVRGLLSGATYLIGVVGRDWLKRETFVQPLGSLVIPSVHETNIFAPPSIRIDIDPSAIFPPDITEISFYIGSPAGIEKYVTWIVDRFEFIDNTGKENKISPTQIKIYYASLIEYNKQNNYNTTVNWQFIDAETNEPTLADTVEFMLNGDGTFFEKSITAKVKYAQDGQYFLINYTDDLKELVENAIIRLVRPKTCTTTEPYFEVCSTIKIVNRRALVTSFYLNAFDTYYLNRRIPVPIPSGDTTVNQLRLFGVPFEHDSPSDFWGQECKNIGRVNFENPQESEIYLEDQVALSGALSETGYLNFLNFFESSKKINFDTVGLNGITGLLVETNTVLIIGQNNNCIVGFDDTIVRINEQGQVVANSIRNQFGQPQTKVGYNYGCALEDKNTISKHEGLVQYLDRITGYLIQHNYSVAQPISIGICDGYLRSKIKFIQKYNEDNTNKRYWHGIVNPIDKKYILSDFVIKSGNFINQLRYFDTSAQETIAFNIYTKKFNITWGFTPEYYAVLESDVEDKQLFSFTNGVAWNHYNTFKKSYGKIYGQNAVRVIEPVLNLDNLTKKKALCVGQYCKESLYFSDQVITETGQHSRILKDFWIQAMFGWYAPFLCALNTPTDPNLADQTGANALLDGNTLTGLWVKIRFIGDPDFDDKYSELAGFTMDIFGVEKTGTQNG